MDETSGTPSGTPEAPDTLGGVEIRTFTDAADLEAWMSANIGLRGGIWLKIAKKGSGLPSVTIGEALDVALCHGWIDGQRRGLDDSYYLQKYTPRRPGSLWSMVNVRKVEALTAAGRMRPRGSRRSRRPRRTAGGRRRTSPSGTPRSRTTWSPPWIAARARRPSSRGSAGRTSSWSSWAC